MVAGSRIDSGTQILSASVRKTIQSIKEIVGNHSDAEIYVTLKETNMDPNETTQKLLNQGLLRFYLFCFNSFPNWLLCTVYDVFFLFCLY